MIIDFNTYLGHYPFRPIRNNDGDGLNRLLEEHSIDKALVSSVSGIYYRDVMKGNMELLDEIGDYGDRFMPVANINPVYSDGEEDLIRCAKLGFKGVKLFPGQHNYGLSCGESVRIMRMAAQYGMFVQIPIYVEDLRQRHNMDIMYPVEADEIKEAVIKAPDTVFILSNYPFESYAKTLEGVGHNVYYDISRMDCLKSNMIGRMIDRYGSEKLLFGTGAPLEYIDVQLVKIHSLTQTGDYSRCDVENICFRNGKKILGI